MPKLTIRLTDSEREQVAASAEATGQTLSMYVRSCVGLSTDPRPQGFAAIGSAAAAKIGRKSPRNQGKKRPRQK